MEAITTTTLNQLLALGLPARRYSFVKWDNETLKVSRKTSGVMIRYNAGSDLYDVTKYNGFDVEPVADGVYADSLLQVVGPVLGGIR